MNELPRLAEKNWNRESAGHLLNRAGFGATPRQRDRMAAESQETIVDRLLDLPESTKTLDGLDWFEDDGASAKLPDGVMGRDIRGMTDMERREIFQKRNKMNQTRIRDARTWWFDRMLETNAPFMERMTLFLHSHFATSETKVRAAYPMALQNRTLREHALGNWEDMLIAVSKDPAMLHYLDNAKSKKRKPNENYGRELLELFSLGEGHYTEEDILAAARAFTGWTINGTNWEYMQRPALHDFGTKTFLGREGKWNGEDIVRIITRKPRAAEFLVQELWTYFAYPNPETGVVQELSAHARKHDLHVKEVLRAMFLHPAFYNERAIRKQIKSPVVWAVNLNRLSGGKRVKGLFLAAACKQLGQHLFAPPSVKGWDGGSTWITASTLALRYTYAERFLKQKGSVSRRILPGRNLSRTEAREALYDHFYGSPLRQSDRDATDAWMQETLPPPGDWTERHLREAVLHIVQTPQFQLI